MFQGKKVNELKSRFGFIGLVVTFVGILALCGGGKAEARQGRVELGMATRAYGGDVHETSRYDLSWQAIIEQNYIDFLSLEDMVVMWGLQGGQAHIEHNYASLVISYAGAVATGYYPLPQPFRRLSLAPRLQGGIAWAESTSLGEVGGSLGNGLVSHGGLGGGLILDIAYGVQLTALYTMDLFFFADGVVVGHGLHMGLGYGRKF